MNWKEKLLTLSILYSIGECGHQFSVNPEGDDKFVDDQLRQCYNNGYLEIDTVSLCYVLSAFGRSYLGKIVDMVNKLLPYEIFGYVEIGRALSEEEADPENANLVASNLFDPRFAGSEGSEDLRLAIIDWLNNTTEQKIDLRDVVFIQKLAGGYLKSPTFWFDLRLGKVFDEIESIVSSAYNWRSISNSEEDSSNIMQIIYTAGMLELKKRQGSKCGNCQIPLAIFEEYSALSECPNPECGASFNSSSGYATSGYSCPKCSSDIFEGQFRCNGCGSFIDFSAPMGSVTTTTEEVVECVPCWQYGYSYYGVEPIYYYDPWDYCVASVALGCLCIALW